MLRPNTFALTTVLALLTGLGPLAMDMYVPSLPEIGRALAASAAQVQLTISGFLIGFAAGQIVYGPLSDRFGRRPVLVGALAIFCAATLMCALARSIDALIVARTLQGAGASGTIVLARAVVRDLYEGPRAGRELSLMGSIMAFAPMIAPVIGGFLQVASGWRTGFVLLFVVGSAAILVVLRLLPETAPLGGARRLALREFLASFAVIAANRRFRVFLALLSASFAGLFAFISGASFVLQGAYGLEPLTFGMVFALCSFGYMAGSFTAAQVVVRVGLVRTIGLGALAMATAGSLMTVAVAVAPSSVTAIAAPMWLYLLGLGLAMPQALAGALQPFPDRAGAASSLMGCIQQTAGAAAGAVVGYLLDADAWPLVLMIAAMGWLTLIVWLTALRGGAEGEKPAR